MVGLVWVGVWGFAIVNYGLARLKCGPWEKLGWSIFEGGGDGNNTRTQAWQTLVTLISRGRESL